MKISPVNNYKKPGYAIKLAALLAAAVSVSACAEGGGNPPSASNGGGAGYKAETEKKEEIKPGGGAPVSDVTSEEFGEPQVDGYLEVPEETTAVRDTQLEGTFPVPEDTAGSAALVTSAVTTAAASGIFAKGTADSQETKYDPVDLDGEAETTEEYGEPELMGDFPVTEYEEPELEGDVAAPEYYETATAGVVPAPEEYTCKSEGCIFAERNFEVLRNAFESYDGLSFTFIEGFDAPGNSRFPMIDEDGNEYSLPAPYLIKTDAEYYPEEYVYVAYMQQDDPFRQFVTKNGKPLYGSYLWEDKGTGLKLLIIDYDGEGADLDPDACAKLARSYAKAMGIS